MEHTKYDVTKEHVRLVLAVATNSHFEFKLELALNVTTRMGNCGL